MVQFDPGYDLDGVATVVVARSALTRSKEVT